MVAHRWTSREPEPRRMPTRPSTIGPYTGLFLCLLALVVEPSAAQSTDRVGTALAPAMLWHSGLADARLVVAPGPDAGTAGAAAGPRWPEDPALGRLLGGVIGCAAGWLLFAIVDTQASSGSDPAWGCIIGGVIGMGAGSGWRMPGDPLARARESAAPERPSCRRGTAEPCW